MSGSRVVTSRQPQSRPQSRPRRTRTTATLFLGALFLGGCSLVGHPAPSPSSPAGVDPAHAGAPAPGWTEVGTASWYGNPYHGRPTASGEVYDMEARTGAHRILPFGSRIRVENLDNGHSSTMTINDRGPFVEGRILDVSRRVARELDMLGPGTARVRITVLEAPTPPRCWMVQVGAYPSERDAQRFRDRLESEGLRARVTASGDGLFRIFVGPFNVEEEAQQVIRRHGGLLVGC
jgi:rare lipoprotein A